ncbi:DNA-binding transcriptional MerR regulator [Kitasatospora sp. SolWspMP-SS2h]|uniref:MerR family transcriptional regulator n=1 Tax=Kitasatospora sp. SolWspMP-SS2h TaxID=1305729 RepID=UPI000DBA32E1|nr:MerR family transcriptional regulator [Kitasatospora sp. SolWspMP-SS2h]RAJ31224.1 DNA-binding transcriptional MerR regulator [Kitasatospora sp. SolWspMP-SS2h]
MDEGYSVGRLAAVAKVTVRTLHHYDRIGLLVPGGRTPAGYRCYGEAELDRLQQILFYRELGFPLEEIAAILDDRTVGPSEHLRRQRELIGDRIRTLEELAAAVERAMEARTMGIRLTPEEKFEVFGADYREEWEDEARQRWGDTPAWEQSRQRTARYTKADWERIKAEADSVNDALVAAFTAGAAPDGEQATAVAEQHRQHIGVNFYDCGPQTHRCLGDMYVADPRFTETYEKLAPGLARWLRDAIHANADRLEREG